MIVAAFSSVPALRARERLEEAREAMERGRTAVAADRLDEAIVAFGDARSLFLQARGEVGSALLRGVALLPLIGRTPDVLDALANAGAGAAAAALLTTSSLDELGGLGALAPIDGRFPIERYAELGEDLSVASALTAASVQEIEATSPWLLPGAVSDARAEAVDQLRRGHQSLARARDMLEELPGFLGVDGTRRYFVGAQNPAELRGTGGLLGSYAILTIENGQPSFSPFRPIRGLNRITPAGLEVVDQTYDRTFGRFVIGDDVWHAYNMTPDTPSAATIMIDAYRAATGVRLDGILLVDPVAVAALLEATGPVRAPELGVELTAENYVPMVTNEVYSLFGSPNERKAALGIASSRVLDAFLAGRDIDHMAAVQSLVSASEGGHVRIYSTDPETQAALVAAGIAGEFDPSEPGDFLGVVVNNVGGNKLDFYADRTVSYAARLEADGSATSHLDVTIANRAPAEGPPAYVIGPCCGDPPIEGFEAGEAHDLVYTFCGAPCEVRSTTPAGVSAGRDAGTYLGAPFLRDAIDIASGSEATLSYDVRSSDAWTGDEYGGVYRLTLRSQPTLRPTTASITVHPPEGMSVVDLDPGWKLGPDGSVTWQGTIGETTELAVAFKPSLGWRAWHRVWDFLTRPVV